MNKIAEFQKSMKFYTDYITWNYLSTLKCINQSTFEKTFKFLKVFDSLCSRNLDEKLPQIVAKL